MYTYGRRGGRSGEKGDHGWMMGPGGMMDYGMMDPERFGDEYLDRIGAHMSERFTRMEQIAETTDKAKRRELFASIWNRCSVSISIRNELGCPRRDGPGRG